MFAKTGDSQIIKVMNVQNGVVTSTIKKCSKCGTAPCSCNKAVKAGEKHADKR